MAIHNGREVKIERIEDVEPVNGVAIVSHPNGITERVNLKNLQMTNDEKKQIEKDHSINLSEANTVSDKDVKEVRKSQDPNKVSKK